MAGFWHLSSTTVFDQIAQPAGGAQAWFYPADTLTQLVVYKDSALTVPWTQPVEADGWGRLPNVYIDDTAASFFRFRITDDTGVELLALATIPILTNTASGGGGGGGGAVDATSVLNTGDMWFSPMQGVRAGAVRGNGRTIGNALSGGSERANADCQALFLFLFQNLSDTIAPVSGGRTTAAADFAANKRIGLPDLRGRAPFGLDGMGNSLAGIITTAVITNNDTPGSPGGSSLHAITVGEMPVHLHGVGTIAAATEGAHTHGIGTYAATGVADHSHGLSGSSAATSHSHSISGSTGAGTAHGHGISGSSGSDTPDHTHGVTIGTAHSTGTWNVMVSDPPSNGSAAFSAGTTGVQNNHTHGAGTYVIGNESAHTHGTGSLAIGNESAHVHGVGTLAVGNAGAHTHALTGTSAAGSAHTHTLSGSTSQAGLGNSMINLSPVFLGTWFIKL